MRPVMIFTMILLLLTMTSCGTVQRPTLEDLGMVGVIGIDVAQGEKIKVTAAVPQPSEEAQEKIQFYQEEVELTREAIGKMSSQADQTLTLAQLRVLIVSESFARKQGIREVLEYMYRSPIVGDNVLIAISKNSAEEVIMGEYPNKPMVTTFLNDLLRPRGVTAFTPFTTLHDFIYSMTDEVSDPSMPYIEKIDHTVRISGLALFRQDKMIDTLSQEEGKLLQALIKRTKLPDLKIKLREDGEEKPVLLLLSFIRSDMKRRCSDDSTNPQYRISLNFTSELLEYTGKRDLSDPKQIEELEEKTNHVLRMKVEKLIEKLQGMKIDPMRAGECLRKKERGGWSKEKWTEALSNATFELEVKNVIHSTGTLY